MDTRSFPTKGNLMANKNSLALAKQGYELMDKKRNILINEILAITDEAASIRGEIDETFAEAYAALERANVQLGVRTVIDMADAVPMENSVKVYARSVMGAEIPEVRYDRQKIVPLYPFASTRVSLDEAMEKFIKVKELTLRLAELENAAFRLATAINKTQKRANALKNITIPRYEELVKSISASLEEKEREDFTRLKVIKRFKENSSGTA